MTRGVIIQPAIMSGGSGTRLWPMSRRARPKQFLPLAGARSLFQETALRVDPEADGRFLRPLVIGGADHAAIATEDLAAIGRTPAAIITEPSPRNTAAVAAVAAAWTATAAPDALVLLMPADHHVTDAEGFRAAVLAGAEAAASGRIVTFGIKPTEPHTGFGYIERGAALGAAYEIAAFREKPNLETARAYVAGGRHFWNAGVFLFSPVAMLAELGAHAPAILDKAILSLTKARRAGVRVDLDAAAFGDCPSDSIDYAVMEKTASAAVVGPLDIGWSDIGSWSAIEANEEDPRVVLVDAPGAMVRTDGPLVAVIGAENLVVVATGDAVLVMPRERAQDVKAVIEELKRRGRGDLL